MVIYIVHHPEPTETGSHYGIDFIAGRGSTSSFQDAIRAVRGGCTLEDPGQQASALAALGVEDQVQADADTRHAAEEGKMQKIAAEDHLRARG